MSAHLELRKNGTRAKRSHGLITGSDRNRRKKLSGKTSTAARRIRIPRRSGIK